MRKDLLQPVQAFVRGDISVEDLKGLIVVERDPRDRNEPGYSIDDLEALIGEFSDYAIDNENSIVSNYEASDERRWRGPKDDEYVAELSRRIERENILVNALQDEVDRRDAAVVPRLKMEHEAELERRKEIARRKFDADIAKARAIVEARKAREAAEKIEAEAVAEKAAVSAWEARKAENEIKLHNLPSGKDSKRGPAKARNERVVGKGLQALADLK